MKKNTLLVLLLTCLSYACYGDDRTPSDFSGEWLLEDGDGSPVECPDLLKLRRDGSYMVFNDCYGVDMERPVTEEGDWRFDGKRSLVLEDRRSEGNYFFRGNSSDPLAIEVIEISEGELVLKINSDASETYRKTKR